MLQNREQHVPVLGAVVPHVVLERVVEDDRVPVAAVRTRLVADGERDKYFTADEAKEYGLVDDVFQHQDKKGA